jgi:DNA-binding HxlR family transcriptional regulator
MASYGQFCPVAKTSEVLCERWVPLILRELMCGSARFNEIRRGVPMISTALLSSRLRQLADRGVITRVDEGRSASYRLTEAGWELYPIIEAMGVWGQRWGRSHYTPDELDPSLLMWDMRRMLQPNGLRSVRTVVEIRFRAAPAGRSVFWLVVDDSIDLCLVDPGHPVDLRVVASLRSLTEVWMGDRTMRSAIKDGSIRLDGPRELVRRFPEWVGSHPVLGSVEPALPGQRASRAPR